MKPALFVEVTRNCNHACTYCGEWRYSGKDTDISVDDYRRVFEAARDVGLTRINFTGGEPTLVRNLELLIQVALEVVNGTSMTVHLTTNGTTITRKKQLWDLPIHLTKVNLQSLDPDAFHRITGDNLLSRVIEGIDFLIERQAPLVVHYVVTHSSLSSVPALFEFAARRRLSLKLFQLDTTLATNDRTPVDVADLVGRLDQLGKPSVRPSPGLPIHSWLMPEGHSIDLIVSGEQRYNAEICKDCDAYPCDYGLYSLSLSPQGWLYPCLIRHEWGAPLRFEEANLRTDLLRMADIIDESAVR